ncbi:MULTISPECIES: CAAD domain-containing protein [unclassified Thermosynechococcus]|uniref:CAAD domain-containing protein n=1 Tax=unclassified Thermosynechococcus TaxID=2622553 RepID=UPI001980AE0E|nr:MULTISPECIES: CAAD domain-containing protein [unclassified Thermosynechococcus]QSF48122.1 CAAD domain-containing protein [Thermosynechococcus sp. TA-1]WNC21137.1 CAAD domain-containing protein [Thermosynechococcus sp. PP22]WNC31388.1 CAAD domain-containing protein [Thermosynechococcus sp. PKX95]WNC33912.1 CAAD domain-containing protein [Thermosynechococcus sp. PKX91]WNC36436.1 CAAD domain-containing protein [Thermosynechococcus sp. WL11]
MNEFETSPTTETTHTEKPIFEPTPAPAPLAEVESQPAPPKVGGLTDEQWQQAREKLYWLLTVFPDQVSAFVGEYKQPLRTLLIILATIPFVALAVAILEVVNAIPLLGPTCELVGFGYTCWFLYRYVLFESGRRELGQKVNEYKSRILGNEGASSS